MIRGSIATLNGTGGVLPERAVESFAGRLQGRLLWPDSPGYDEARRVWNGMIDRRPALIARCAGTDDVVEAVRFAREHDLLVSVRGGGHSAAGYAVCDDGLVIDLSQMTRVQVDAEARTARAQGGAKWADFDSATQAHGLATTGGTNSDTGIGGLTLGGGLGWLAGKYGLTCDNLLAAEVVTAEGRVLIASADEHPELFWGLRGGSGNFGIVTQFTYRLHPVSTVLGGMVVHGFDQAAEVLRFYSEFSSDTPDELNTVGMLLTSPEGAKVVSMVVCYNGPLDEGERVLQPLRAFGQPLVDHIGPMPYLALQTMLDEAFPQGRPYYWKAHLAEQIGETAIDTAIDHFAAVPSPMTFVGFQQLGNAANRVDPDATAFSHRDARYDFLMLSSWADPAEATRNIEWTRGLYEAMKPSLHPGIYVNAVDDDAASYVEAAYRPRTYQRLAALKAQYDPTNFFRFNANIAPQG